MGLAARDSEAEPALADAAALFRSALQQEAARLTGLIDRQASVAERRSSVESGNGPQNIAIAC
ncbi:MAG: hypothetical protein U0872_00765 [Planctomycetaceae bacterium]